jgi:RNA polymerase sigma factor (sigma-70 family)
MVQSKCAKFKTCKAFLLSNEVHIHQLANHLFRTESKKMVAVLTKIFGPENFETAEDVVQETLLQAMQVWKLKGIPSNPSAWLFQVARNKATDIVRKNKYSTQYDFNDPERKLLTSEYTLSMTMDQLWNENHMQDEFLQMMFACCNPELSAENQITLILKTLCGFSTFEIAKAFLTSEDVVSKRLYRTKEFFRENKIRFAIPSQGELETRVDAVLNTIYLLFNEGYNSTNNEKLIRKELIEEAIALCRLLAENKLTQLPQVFAFLALMLFHAARLDSRISNEGEIILLDQQDRSSWDRDLIAEGNYMMNLAATGGEVSLYHLEAAIAYEHCIAESMASTNWKNILGYYDWLLNISPSVITALNRVVAVMQMDGPAAALMALQEIADRKKLESYYLYHSLLGEIHSRLNESIEAKSSFEKALALTQSEAEKKLIQKKMDLL